MRLSKRIWDFFLADGRSIPSCGRRTWPKRARRGGMGEKYQVLVYEMWFESEGVHLDLSEFGLVVKNHWQDTEFVDIPDQFLLPCNMSGSPTMGKKPFAYLFNEKGLKWLEPLLTCSKEHKEWRMEEGRSRAKSWWKRQARALAKLKQVVVDEEARLRGQVKARPRHGPETEVRPWGIV